MTGCAIYSIFLILFLIWTLINLWSRWNQLIEPVSSNGFDLHPFQQLIYPSITVCNITPNVKLHHNKCLNYETELNCEYKEETIKLKKSFLKTKQNFASCLTYNFNLDDAFVATKLGMQDMLIISMKIGINEYPKTSLTSGVHISLHSQNSKSEIDYGLMASPGELFLVRLKKTVNEYLNSTSIESFDGKISTMGDHNFEENFGLKNDTVALAFVYEDLNVMIVRELPPYDILTFLSETGGVLGLLLGTSLVNLVVFLLQWSWGLRLNEYNWMSVKNKPEIPLDKTKNHSKKNKSEKGKNFPDENDPTPPSGHSDCNHSIYQDPYASENRCLKIKESILDKFAII
jgi:hypothetical protein